VKIATVKTLARKKKVRELRCIVMREKKSNYSLRRADDLPNKREGKERGDVMGRSLRGSGEKKRKDTKKEQPFKKRRDVRDISELENGAKKGMVLVIET